MSSEGVIRIKGDTGELVAALDKAGLKFQVLGKHAQNAVGHSKSFGEAWQHANRHLESALVRGITIAHVIKAAADAMKEFQDKAAEASKTVGGLGIKRDQSAARLGLDNESAESLLSGRGSATAEARTGFFAKLSERQTVGRIRRKPTRRETAKAMAAFNSGLYSAEEIDEALDRGHIDTLDVGGRLKELSPDSRAEFETLSSEFEKGESARQTRATSGRRIREADAKRDLRDANHPVIAGFSEFVGAATERLGGKAIITAFDRDINADYEKSSGIPEGIGIPGGGQTSGWLRVAAAIRAQTNALNAPPLPTVSGGVK